MRGLRAGVVGLFSLWCCTVAWAAPATPQTVDVRNLITVTQFHETGLDTLLPQQLDALNAWLSQYLASHSAPGSTPVDVRNVITVSQFDQSGLDKLAPGQFDAFNNWLNQYLSTRVAAPRISTKSNAPAIANFGADTMAVKENPAAPDLIETRIVGLFTGWNGNTVFKLANGQIWQQAGTGYFDNVKLDHPQVVIKKLGFGYLLTLPGHGETVFVRRVR